MSDDLIDRIDDFRRRDLAAVKFGVTDIDGVIRGKYVSIDKLASIAARGGGFCDCILGWDVADQLYDNTTFTGWHTAYPDARVQLVGSSERLLPDEQVPYFIAQFVADDGGPHPICPRTRLAGVLEAFAALGMRARMGFEYEFFVFDETPHSIRAKGYRDLQPVTPGNFGYSMIRASVQGELFNGLLEHCRSLRLPIEGLHCETGPGVWEAALASATGVEAADAAALFKTFTKVWLQRAGKLATFMAKWSMDYPGMGGHLHLSLEDIATGANRFWAADAPDRISAEQRWFIGGLQRHLPDLLALVAPTINSFARLVPGAWAPTAATWGIENRTAALRVLGGSASSQRVEVRVPGADANPYLAAAAVLACGYGGIRDRLEPTAPVQGNAYAVQQQLAAALQFPPTLREAAGRLDRSALARELLGDAFVDHFVQTRLWESRQYEAHVNGWQLERYFEII